MRIIGIDLGEKRIGVAAADDRTRVAIPVTTVNAGDDPVAAVEAVVRDQSADELVVGLPLSMTGAMGPQGELVMSVVERLQERLTIPVHTWDERLTTVEASRRPSVPYGRLRRKSARTALAGRDAAAAAIMLQAFMDSRRPDGASGAPA